MSTTSDIEQAHGTCGGVELVKWDLIPPLTIGQRKKSKKIPAVTDKQ